MPEYTDDPRYLARKDLRDRMALLTEKLRHITRKKARMDMYFEIARLKVQLEKLPMAPLKIIGLKKPHKEVRERRLHELEVFMLQQGHSRIMVNKVMKVLGRKSG